MSTAHSNSFAYSVYGATLLTDVTLKLPLATAEGHPVVRLEAGDVQAFETARAHLVTVDPNEWLRHAVLPDGSVFIRWDAWLEFIVSTDGGLVKYHRLTNDMLDAFEAYVANFAISAALVQSGEEPLHATVVEFDGQAVGLLGQSGAGKSTLAAYLLGQGAKLVTDDMLRITLREDMAFAEPGPMRLKLYEEPGKRYLESAGRQGLWNPFAQKFLFEPGNPRELRSASPLLSLFWLSAGIADGDPADVAAERLAGLELFRIISASTMNSRLNTPERLQRQFRFAERIGRILPVYRLSYPRRHESFPNVLRVLKRALP